MTNKELVQDICMESISNEEKIKKILNLVKEKKEEICLNCENDIKIYFTPELLNNKNKINIYIQYPSEKKEVYACQMLNMNNKYNFYDKNSIEIGKKLGEIQKEYKDYVEYAKNELKNKSKKERKMLEPTLISAKEDYLEKRNDLISQIKPIMSRDLISKLANFEFKTEIPVNFSMFISKLRKKIKENEMTHIFVNGECKAIIYSNQITFLNLDLCDNLGNQDSALYKLFKKSGFHDEDYLNIDLYNIQPETYLKNCIQEALRNSEYNIELTRDTILILSRKLNNIENIKKECVFLNKSIKLKLNTDFISSNKGKGRDIVFTKDGLCCISSLNNKLFPLSEEEINTIFEKHILKDYESVHFFDKHNREYNKDDVLAKLKKQGLKKNIVLQTPRKKNDNNIYKAFFQNIYIKKENS